MKIYLPEGLTVDVSVKVTVNRYPRYRIGQAKRGGFFKTGTLALQVQKTPRGKWLMATAEGKLLLTTDKAKASRWLAWLADPEGTRAEWETEPKDV